MAAFGIDATTEPAQAAFDRRNGGDFETIVVSVETWAATRPPISGQLAPAVQLAGGQTPRNWRDGRTELDKIVEQVRDPVRRQGIELARSTSAAARDANHPADVLQRFT
jgi:hypothetical protein